MSLPLEDALRQCDRHAQRMNRAMERIPFPLDGHELAEWLDRLKVEFELRKAT